MKLIDVLECRGEARSRRRLYITTIFACLIFMGLRGLSGVTEFWPVSGLLDFQNFYVVGGLVWKGKLQDAYYAAAFSEHIHQLFPGRFSPWTYPPPFGLIAALYALPPIGVAYVLAMTATFVFYYASLRFVLRIRPTAAFIIFTPALFANLTSGQNGFLMGGLAAITCGLLLRGNEKGGISLGAMALIKPHLALTLTFLQVMRRQWNMLLFALTTGVSICLLVSVLGGFGVWTAFLHGVREAGAYLSEGRYPLRFMVSIYAFFYTAGFSPGASFALQSGVSIGVILSIVVLQTRRDFRETLGCAVFSAPLTSPYAYSYDLLVSLVGFSLISPCLKRYGSERERLLVYLLIFFTGAYIQLRPALSGFAAFQRDEDAFTPAGLMLVSAYVMILTIILRKPRLALRPPFRKSDRV